MANKPMKTLTIGKDTYEVVDEQARTDIGRKFDKTGGTVTGDLTVEGNLTVQGTTTTVDSTTLQVEDKLIKVAKNNTVALTSPAGIVITKYNGSNDGAIVYDNTGTAYVGKVVFDGDGDIDSLNSELQPIVTRNDIIQLENRFTGGDFDKNGNLIFEDEIVSGAYWYEVDGTEIKNQYTGSYCRTKFIEIEPSTSYCAICLGSQDSIKAPYSICFYTAGNTFISGFRYKTVFTAPANAKYIGLSWREQNDMIGVGAFILKKSTTDITKYEAPSYLPVHIVGSDYVTEDITDNLDERVTALEGETTITHYIKLASDYYITKGDSLELFYRGLINLGDYKKYNIKITCSVGGCFEKRYIFKPTESNVGNDYAFTLSLYDDKNEMIESASSTIHCIAKKNNPSNKVNVLCIGDSLTVNGEWVTELQRLISTDGLSNINFIGTCGNAPAKYEGYGGWTIEAYSGSMSTSAYMWVNVTTHDKTSADQHSVYIDGNGTKWKIETIEASRLKMIRTSGTSDISTSGILTWESGGDNHEDIVYSSVTQASGNPFWSESKNKIDFTSYASDQGISSIDYCLILIGWNQSEWSETRTKESTKYFINLLKEEYPNCKFILGGLQVPSLDGCGNNYGCAWYWKDKVDFVFNLEKWYVDLKEELSNIAYAQVSGQFDTENNMPIYQRQVNKRNTTMESYGGNGVHPAYSGYMQIADVFYRAFHAF